MNEKSYRLKCDGWIITQFAVNIRKEIRETF